MKQPTKGGSYVYDPKKDDLKQVEKPTEHLNPNASLPEDPEETPPTAKAETQKETK